MGNSNEYYQRLLPSLIPESFQNNWLLAFAKATGAQIDDIYAFRDDIIRQLFVGTASWGLERWEGDLGLPTGQDLPEDLRRARIMARLLRTGGMRPVDLQDALAALGFPGSSVEELFRSIAPLPIYDGSRTHQTGYRTGFQWAMFRLKLGISDFRDFLAADREEIIRLVDEIKPAHMALAGMDLLMPLSDDAQPVDDKNTIVAALHPADLFLRAGFRHAGANRYQLAPQHDARFLYNCALLHNKMPPGVVLVHRCEDEATSLEMALRIGDFQRVWASHAAWPRRGLRYGPAAALEVVRGKGNLRFADQSPPPEERFAPQVSTGFFERYHAILGHGPVKFPGRDGSLLYRSGFQHRPAPPRDGKYKYGSHLSRLLGPRRDGRNRYGHGWLDQAGAGLDLKLSDRQSVSLKTRNARFFYRDSDVLHGPGRPSLEAPVYVVQVFGGDDVPLPGDQATTNAKVAVGDVYPGRSPRHGAPDQPRHDGRMVHRLGSYAWVGDRYNGRLRHAPAPGEVSMMLQTGVSVSDAATFHRLYGGFRACHDGGGPRWRHQGNALRRPFAFHDGVWFHDGARRYLEARARYGDRAALRDGLDRYGRSAGLHDGTISRRPAAPPDDLLLVVRRGYRRVAV